MGKKITNTTRITYAYTLLMSRLLCSSVYRRSHKTQRRYCCTYTYDINRYIYEHTQRLNAHNPQSEESTTKTNHGLKEKNIWTLPKNYRARTTFSCVSRAEQRTPATRGVLHGSKMLKSTPWQYSSSRYCAASAFLLFYYTYCRHYGHARSRKRASTRCGESPRVLITEQRFRYCAAVY